MSFEIISLSVSWSFFRSLCSTFHFVVVVLAACSATSITWFCFGSIHCVFDFLVWLLLTFSVYLIFPSESLRFCSIGEYGYNTVIIRVHFGCELHTDISIFFNRCNFPNAIQPSKMRRLRISSANLRWLVNLPLIPIQRLKYILHCQDAQLRRYSTSLAHTSSNLNDTQTDSHPVVLWFYFLHWYFPILSCVLSQCCS